jgi:predicted O-methyltransferase YrrM
MQFDDVRERVSGIQFATASPHRIYEHIRRTRPEAVLELGTAHGVSTSYIAAALEANGVGHLTTVDHGGASFDPPPEKLLHDLGLEHRVTIVRAHSSYNWFLKEQIEAHSDKNGNCEPIYDFCFLDGAHNFDIDGLAVVLVEKLLRPGGWLLLDDLDWTYEIDPWSAPELWPDGHAKPFGPLSDEQRAASQVRAVFDVVLKQHLAFTRFICEDEWYVWAQKAPGEPRRYELASSRPLAVLVAAGLRRRMRPWLARR